MEKSCRKKMAKIYPGEPPPLGNAGHGDLCIRAPWSFVVHRSWAWCTAVGAPTPPGPPREEDRPDRSLRALTIRSVPALDPRFLGCTASLFRPGRHGSRHDVLLVSVPAVGTAAVFPGVASRREVRAGVVGLPGSCGPGWGLHPKPHLRQRCIRAWTWTVPGFDGAVSRLGAPCRVTAGTCQRQGECL